MQPNKHAQEVAKRVELLALLLGSRGSFSIQSEFKFFEFIQLTSYGKLFQTKSKMIDDIQGTTIRLRNSFVLGGILHVGAKHILVLLQTSMVNVMRPCWISKLEPCNGVWHLSENGKPCGQFDVIVIAHNGSAAIFAFLL